VEGYGVVAPDRQEEQKEKVRWRKAGVMFNVTQKLL
jgi:hypothetical protein